MKLKLKKIVLVSGAFLALTNLSVLADINVTGKVCNADGEPLTGVAVMIKGKTTGTSTDIDGNFSLKSAPDNSTLVFSYTGYKSETAKASKSMNIVLKENAQILGEVVVTTQKRRQTSIEVPVAVSAITGLSLDHLNLRQMDEMSTFIPGLQVQIQSPNNPGYVIRGVTSDGGESYSQPRISAFMDGVSISRSRASVVELFDLERVEVVKGPQGTLFGRGAEIGAMHIIRNKPTNKLSGEISLNYGSHNQRGANGFINTPITEKLSNRFAFSYDAHDGYIKNLSGGRLNGKSAIALRNSTRWFAGENTVLDLILDYQHDDYPGTSFKSNALAPVGGDTDPNTAASLERGKELGIKRNVGGATFLADHTINDSWKMTSITGFRAFNSDEVFDADGTYLTLLNCEEKAKGTQFSQEFRFNYDNNGRFSGFVGASYFFEHSSQDVTVNTNMQQLYPAYIQSQFAPQINTLTSLLPLLGQALGLPDASLSAMNTQLSALNQQWFPSNSAGSTATNLPDFYGDLSSLLSAVTGGMMNFSVLETAISSGAYDSLLSQYGLTKETILTGLATLKSISNASLENSYTEQSTNYGTNQAAEIFADGTFHIAKGLSLTAGLRGTYEHQKTGYSSTTVGHPIFGVIMYSPSAETVYASDNYYSWVGRVALNYMFKRNNAYISISRGRRPGVISFNNSPDEIIKLRPEIIISYEAGIKGSILNSRLGYDLSVYYYDWNHFQTTRLSESSTSVSRVYVADDAGKAHSFGVEVGLRYAITNNINVFGNYSYIDGKFNNTDEDGNEQEYAGNSFRLTPKHSFALGLDVNIPVSKTTGIYIRPSYSYKSKVYFEDDNNPLLAQDGYGLANFNAGVRFKPKNVYYEISAFGKNVFNEKYIVDAGNTGYQINYPTFVAGSPSVFGVQVKVGF